MQYVGGNMLEPADSLDPPVIICWVKMWKCVIVLFIDFNFYISHPLYSVHGMVYLLSAICFLMF